MNKSSKFFRKRQQSESFHSFVNNIMVTLQNYLTAECLKWPVRIKHSTITTTQ